MKNNEGIFKLPLTGLSEKIKKNKYLIVILVVGIVLLLWPTGNSEKDTVDTDFQSAEEAFSLEEREERLEEILQKVNGAGKVSVLLSVDGSTERLIASDSSCNEEIGGNGSSFSEDTSAVVIDHGSSESVVELKYIFPKFTGAVIVAEGAGNSAVKLAISQAVSAVTGLGTDKISVIKMAIN